MRNFLPLNGVLLKFEASTQRDVTENLSVLRHTLFIPPNSLVEKETYRFRLTARPNCTGNENPEVVPGFAEITFTANQRLEYFCFQISRLETHLLMLQEPGSWGISPHHTCSGLVFRFQAMVVTH